MDFMAMAVAQATLAARKGEVPVGCVIVRNGKVIAKGYNQREQRRNSLWHAEMVAINRACRKLRAWRLTDCEMYVTLAPCQMCMGAIVNARIKTVYVGVPSTSDLNWQTSVVMQPNDAAKNILVAFFRDKR